MDLVANSQIEVNFEIIFHLFFASKLTHLRAKLSRKFDVIEVEVGEEDI